MAIHDFAVPRVALDDGEPMVLSSWLLDEGAEVREGDPVLEVETSKASMEIEAPRDGVLAVRLRQAGATVSAGELIGLIADAGEPYDAEALRRAASDEVPAPVALVSEPKSPAEPPAAGVPVGGGLAAPPVAGPRAGDRPLAPVALVPERPADVPPALPVAAGFLVGPPPVPREARAVPAPAVTIVPLRESPQPESLSPHRVAVGRLMTASAAVPQFSVQLDIAVEEAEGLVARLRTAAITATFTDVLLKAAALTLRRHPRYNAWLSDETFMPHDRVSISLAADGPAGVIAPVVHDVDRRGWRGLAAERGRVVAGAREGRLRPEHLTGGTFSISNIGPLGAEVIVPLLSPPQVGILGVGRVRDVAGRRTMTAVLVSDHRAVDGADAARFLATFASLLGDADRLTFADSDADE